MNKLTAEKCKTLIEGLGEDKRASRISIFGELYLQALEIALPVLEQHEPAEWTNEQCLEFLSIAFRHAEISGDIEMDDIRLAVKMVNTAHKQSQPATPQIDNDGWIELGEGAIPVHPETVVEIKMRNGATDGPGKAGRFLWYRGNAVRDEMGCDIVAYRVIENDGREG